jgi:hypothetical protein
VEEEDRQESIIHQTLARCSASRVSTNDSNDIDTEEFDQDRTQQEEEHMDDEEEYPDLSTSRSLHHRSDLRNVFGREEIAHRRGY